MGAPLKNLVYFLLFSNPERASWHPDDYLEQLQACLQSLKKTSDPAGFDVLFLADAEKAEKIRALPEIVGLTTHVRVFEVPRDLKSAMCTRFRIHELFRDELSRYGKVLYLDIDIVLLRDVAEIFRAVTDPALIYVKADHWCGVRTDSKWFSCGHPEEERRAFEERGIEGFNSGQFAFVNGPDAAATFADLCAELPELLPRSRLGFDQPVMNSFLRSRHLVWPCLEQQAMDALCHLEGESQPRSPDTALVHFIKANKLPRMRAELGIEAPKKIPRSPPGVTAAPTASTAPPRQATSAVASTAPPRQAISSAQNSPPQKAATVARSTPDPAPNATLSQAMQLQQKGMLREAEGLFRRGLEQQPDHAGARARLGYLLFQTGRFTDALRSLDQALSLRPDVAETHTWRGLALARLGRNEEAAAAYSRSVQIEPKHAGAQNNLGMTLFALRKYKEAIPCFERAISLGHRRPEPFIMIGRARGKVGDNDGAERAYRDAIALDPRSTDALVGLANLLHDKGDLDGSFEPLRRAVAADPKALGARSNLVSKMLYHDSLSPEEMAKAHFEAGAAYVATYASSGDPAFRERDRDPSRRLKIGYLSPDLHMHATAFFLEPLFEGHDKGEVEIHCYSSGGVHDEMTERLRALANGFTDVASMTFRDAAAKIAADRIDVLIDCAGHTNNHRLAVLAMKPAPIQATWLGYPHGTGMSTVDYRITDAPSDPPGMTESHYRESLVRLPEGAFCYKPPRETPEPSPGPMERGEGPVFGCFNRPHKIGPRTIRLWADVVRAAPGAKLRLKARQFLDPGTIERFRAWFEEAGLARDRLEIEGRPTFMEGFAEYGTIDIALDPYPYHGTTSTCESFWMGVPVVTLPGQTCVSRVGVSLLERVGLSDLVARDEDDYRRIAVSLAADRARLSHLRRTLRETMKASTLGDGKRFARQMEEALRAMWRRRCEQGS